MLDGNVLLRQKRDEVPEGTLSCPDRNLAVFHHYRHYEGLRLLPSVYDSKLIQQTLNKPGLLFRLVRFATVACKDRGVLLLVGKCNRVLAVHLQPLVKLVLVYLPALALLGCRNLTALQLHVERVLRHAQILCCFLYRHKTMPILFLLLILSVVKALQ